MKTLHKLLFSVLLAAFGFFVVHDYVIENVDADTQYELCYAQESCSAMDLPTQIHDHIHVLLSMPETLAVPPSDIVLGHHRNGRSNTPNSYIYPIQPRPPLS